METFRKAGSVLLTVALAAAAFILTVSFTTPNTASSLTSEPSIQMGIVQISDSIPRGAGSIPVHFSWFYKGQQSLDVSLPEASYREYVSRERATGAHGKAYFSEFDTPNDPVVDSIARKLETMADEQQLTDAERILLVTRMVQSIPYATDESTQRVSQYIQYPEETLAYNYGDCEDTALLAASILQNMGYDVRLAYMTNPVGQDHLAIAVAIDEDLPGTYVEEDGTRYYYVETVGPEPGKVINERQPGQVPAQFSQGKMSLLSL